MTKLPILLAIAAFAFTGAAQAQSYGRGLVQPAPFYPYEAQPQYGYPAQSEPRAYPYVGPSHARAMPRKRSKVDHALVEELRKGRNAKHVGKTIDKTIDKKIVVRDKPVVRKHYRVVDDPPIVVQREIDESQVAQPQPYAYRQPAPQPYQPQPQPYPQPQYSQPAEHGAGRTIHAEAEVTILGPDRMTIRLYRKRDGREANAKVLHKKKIKLD